MLHEVSFHSFNDRDEVQGWVYVPACKPKGIVQVIHDFGEHSRRYFHMIVKFMDAGISLLQMTMLDMEKLQCITIPGVTGVMLVSIR